MNFNFETSNRLFATQQTLGAWPSAYSPPLGARDHAPVAVKTAAKTPSEGSAAVQTVAMEIGRLRQSTSAETYVPAAAPCCARAASQENG